jgi:hypothetical protein
MMEEFGHIMYPTKCRVYESEVRTELDYNACIRRYDTGAVISFATSIGFLTTLFKEIAKRYKIGSQNSMPVACTERRHPFFYS